MTKKQGFRAALFFVVLGMILSIVFRVFGIPLEQHNVCSLERFNEFYREPENTWDCVAVGTSCIDRGWVAPLAWNDYGMTVYEMATDGQPMILVTGLLEEVRKTQDVKLAIIDIRGARLTSSNMIEAKIRRVTDAMKYSVNRQKTIKKAIDVYQDFYTCEEVRDAIGDEEADARLEELDGASMYFPFLKYHSRWETGLQKTDFIKEASDMKGVFDYKKVPFKVKAVKKPELSVDATVELLDIQKRVLDEVLKYGEDTELDMLFISMPVSMDKQEQIELNSISRYLEEKGATVINYNTEEKYEEVGLDFSGDFYNENHMNSRGAVKFTESLARYLNENYDFEDKRGREEYREWDEAYKKYVKFYEEGWNK